ncbi:endonuclease/exonuclease/phosphatase family protein [Yoonia sp. GPGPB17]|uniref:endonuclease/exonuclease/phosphatase family protein n=1 Tax=Yoonia sp. GPGPB17 TaxID=3026147 RepID=UPI0030BDA781
MRFLVLMTQAGAFCLILAVLLGFAGALHPAFDSLSLLRLPLAILCLLVLVFPMRVRLRLMLAGTALLGAATTVPMFFAAPAAGELRIYSKNMWYGNPEGDALAADIRASEADVVALQEVSLRNGAMLAGLQDVYPYQHMCTFNGWNGIAVLSRTPMRQQTCTERRAVAAAMIEHRDGQVWVASMHLSWPFPYANATSAQAATEVLSEMEGPVVIAGDFNIFPWANSVRSLQKIADLQVAQPVRSTLDLRGVPLMLDHVHAPGGGRVQYRALLGSDHLGVLADVSLTR